MAVRNAPKYANPPSSIGTPVAGAEIHILDESFRPVADDQEGEIFIGGPGVALGYLDSPELTAEKFLTLPDISEQRLYRSGDRARWLPDRQIQFLGRSDDQVKIRGNRIELGDITTAMLDVPGVRGAVTLIEDAGNLAEKKIVGFIVAEGSDTSLIAAVREHIRETLPPACLPAAILLIERIPLTANGKTDRQALSGLYRCSQIHTGSTFSRPMTVYESVINDLWCELLGRTSVDPEDDFFSIGGHSLLAARFSSALTKRLNVRSYVRDIYEYPTIRSLAGEIEKRMETPEPAQEGEPVRELQEDVYLPEGIAISPDFERWQVSDPRHIFLSGVTGFIGSHLLFDLLKTSQADIVCLIRSRNAGEARVRLQNTLQRYAITLSDAQMARVIPVSGDLSEKYFGMDKAQYLQLSHTIDVIYHSASAVNFIQPYSYMKRDNVQALREVIGFAAQTRTKPLMLMSTISVYSWGNLFTGKSEMSERDDIDQNLAAVSRDIGYVRSK